MRKQTQLYNHNPECGITGDCWRASIACVLDLDVKEVPHLLPVGVDFQQARREMNTWLRHTQGLMYVEFPVAQDMADTARFAAGYLDGVYWILTGKSSTPGTDHCEVWYGGEFCHSTNQARVIGPARDSGYYWCGLLVKASGDIR